MEIVFEIWVRLFESYAEEVFFQESSGVFSFMVIGVLVFLYKQEKEQQKKCSCSDKEKAEECKKDRASS